MGGGLYGAACGNGYPGRRRRRRVAPDEHIDRASTMALLDKAIEEYITSSGEIALKNENGFTVINAAASARDTEGVTLSGQGRGALSSAGTAADVTADGLTAGSVRIDGRTSVSLDGAASAGRVNVHAAASVSVGASSQAGEITPSRRGCVAVRFRFSRPRRNRRNRRLRFGHGCHGRVCGNRRHLRSANRAVRLRLDRFG